MSLAVRQRGFFLELAAEALLQQLGVEEGLSSPEPAINRFGPAIVQNWQDWMRGKPRNLQESALGELADLPTGKAQQLAVSTLEQFEDAPQDPILRSWALRYLSVIPRCAQRLMVPDPYTGDLALPVTREPDQIPTLLAMLPFDSPPFPPDTLVPESKYWLGEVHCVSEVGPAYRAAHADHPDEGLDVQFCVDSSLIDAMRQQNDRLEKLKTISGMGKVDRLVALIDFDLTRELPMLVRERSRGATLNRIVMVWQRQSSQGLDPEETLSWIVQMAEGLALLHDNGLAHQDLKPANVLVEEGELRLTGMDVGAVLAEESPPGDPESWMPAEQVRFLEGAASWLYSAPEKQSGEERDPSQDVYSLGVIWYQLLTGDLTQTVPETWKVDLRENCTLSRSHWKLLEQCLAPRSERFSNARELLHQMGTHQASAKASPEEESPSTVISQEEIRSQRERQQTLLRETRDLLHLQEDLDEVAPQIRQANSLTAVMGCLIVAGLLALNVMKLTLPGVAMTLIPLVILGAYLIIRRRRKRLTAARLQLGMTITTFRERYAAEIQSWGGEMILRNPELLREMIATLENDAGLINHPT